VHLVGFILRIQPSIIQGPSENDRLATVRHIQFFLTHTDFHCTTLQLQHTCIHHYYNTIKTEILKETVELITPYFSHSSNLTVSHTECSHAIYTKSVTIYTLFTRFNYACKV